MRIVQSDIEGHQCKEMELDQLGRVERVNEFRNKLLSLTIVCALSMFFSQFYLIKQVSNVTEINQRQQLEITVYKNELKEQQKIHAFLNEKNRELRGQNNFLESQNKMLMGEVD